MGGLRKLPNIAWLRSGRIISIILMLLVSDQAQYLYLDVLFPLLGMSSQSIFS